MSSKDTLSFAMEDEVLGGALSPTNLTLPLLKDYIEQVQSFLKGSHRTDLNEVKASIVEGSLAVVADNASGVLGDAAEDYAALKNSQVIEDMDPIRARIIELWQADANKHPNRVYKLSLGDTEGNGIIEISGKTNYVVKKDIWVNVEVYAYGTIYDLGGKSKSNVHLELDNGSTLTIETSAKVLGLDNENRLYKRQLVRIRAEQNLDSKKLRNEQLVAFEEYDPRFDEAEFEALADKVQEAWGSVKSTSSWVEELRGSNA